MTAKSKKIFSIYIESLMLKNGCGDDVSKFANLLGISQRTMYEWLRAKCFPNNRSLVKLKKLGADVDYILQLMWEGVK